MKKIFILYLTIFSILSCNLSAEKIKNNKELNNILENYYQDGLKLNPINATAEGDSRYNDKFPELITDDYKNSQKLYYKKYLNEISNFDINELSDLDKMSKSILEWECNINLESLNFNTEYTPIDQMWSIHLIVGQLASAEGAQPFKTIEDYNNWLIRLNGYINWLENSEIKMREGMKKGYVLPKSLISKVIPQIKSLTNSDLKNNLFYSPINNFPSSFEEKSKSKIKEKYSYIIKEKLIPAHNKLYLFLKDEYFKKGRISSGIDDVPNGKELYKHLIKVFTTTDMTADEIHNLGLSEVSRISNEMIKVKNQVGFKGSLKEFFDFVRTNDTLMPFKNSDEIIKNFNSIHDRMKPEINKMFDLKPKTKFEVRRTEEFREKSASAEYSPGSLDGSRPGIFYTPIPDATKYNTYSDESLFLHEAIPGHHYQISLTQENELLPMFRKTLWHSGYGEGWALYSESLGKELGLYEDPYQYFGMLGAEMHRAIRLVVDTGIHSKGWTREEAILYSLENEAESEASIISEIERYMAMPGQALSYKIGQLKIKELREISENKLGDKFNISEFHNKILESGSIPLDLLQNKINNWIDSKLN
ncbi:DUF885 domain-containing protein [Flavobacteriaceae bacterium]|nr:DUF885 domain-containing protein [Flavobacteriaceae bacterium]MDC1534856.1 DUF885 domain-containing protein [Flavobacteriaceae bacterium]